MEWTSRLCDSRFDGSRRAIHRLHESRRRYAYAGRDWVCQRVARILGAEIQEEVHNHHNFAWRESHGGEDYWVVRKGATPAFPGQKGFVGGTMGETSVILEGVENEAAKHSLYSTVHGAGRVMGRMEAKGKVDRKTGAVLRPGKVSQEMMREWVDRAGVELRGAGLDESPHCYKRLPKSSPNTATAFASSTPSPPSASPWPAQTNSIPTRTDFPGARRSYEGSAINSRFKNVDYGHSLCGAFSF